MKKFFVISFIKKILFLIFAISFLNLVNFEDFSFETVIPEPQTQIKNKSEVGGIRNSYIDNNLNSKISFKGTEKEIIELVNRSREENGLDPLKENKKLNASALAKAQHMKDNDYFDHVSPQGLQPWYFAQKQDYNYKFFGENLAEGYFSVQSVHDGWMESPGHRENILSEDFKEIGAAILDFEQNGQESYLIVQHFGTELQPEDLVTKIVCDKKSKKNCEEAENQKEEIEDLVKEQEKIIKEAEKAEAGQKDLNRLEENLDDLEDAREELEDFLDECEDFIKKCDTFK